MDDPADGKAVSGTVFTAVFVYIVRLCSSDSNPKSFPTFRTLYAIISVNFFLLLIMLSTSRASLCFAVYKECCTFERAGGVVFLCKADYTMRLANKRFFSCNFFSFWPFKVWLLI